jgi:peptidoglycan/LPS O-acetylase OafA/YrhL
LGSDCDTRNHACRVLCRDDLLHAATYTMNYHHVRAWQLNHIWSLAVEEQFYLLWPTVLCLFGPTRSIRAAAGMILAVPLIRL